MRDTLNREADMSDLGHDPWGDLRDDIKRFFRDFRDVVVAYAAMLLWWRQK